PDAPALLEPRPVGPGAPQRLLHQVGRLAGLPGQAHAEPEQPWHVGGNERGELGGGGGHAQLLSKWMTIPIDSVISNGYGNIVRPASSPVANRGPPATKDSKRGDSWVQAPLRARSGDLRRARSRARPGPRPGAPRGRARGPAPSARGRSPRRAATAAAGRRRPRSTGEGRATGRARSAAGTCRARRAAGRRPGRAPR